MGYLAAGPGKEGFNVYTFSDRVPINSNSDAQKYLAFLKNPPIINRLARWSTRWWSWVSCRLSNLKEAILIPIVLPAHSASWQYTSCGRRCTTLSLFLPPPSLGYLQPCPPTAPRGNHTWWWTKLVQDRTERIYLGNWHCNKNKLVVIVSCREPWSETCSKFAKVWKLGRWLPWSPFWVGDTFWPN